MSGRTVSTAFKKKPIFCGNTCTSGGSTSKCMALFLLLRVARSAGLGHFCALQMLLGEVDRGRKSGRVPLRQKGKGRGVALQRQQPLPPLQAASPQSACGSTKEQTVMIDAEEKRNAEAQELDIKEKKRRGNKETGVRDSVCVYALVGKGGGREWWITSSSRHLAIFPPSGEIWRGGTRLYCW